MVLGILLVKYEPSFAIITVVTLSLYITFTFKVTNWRTALRRQANELDSAANARAIDSLINFETVKYFNNEAFEARRYDTELAKWTAAQIRNQKSLSLLNIGQAAIIAVGVTAMMWRAALGVANGSMTLGDLVLVGAGNPTYHFARWRYEEPSTEPTLHDDGTDDRRKRVSNLNPTAFRQFQTELGADITDDDVFHYVYGALHSPEFRSRYESNLKKEASRVPMAPDRVTFDAYRDAGAELMELHIGYETVEPYPIEEHWSPSNNCRPRGRKRPAQPTR